MEIDIIYESDSRIYIDLLYIFDLIISIVTFLLNTKKNQLSNLKQHELPTFHSSIFNILEISFLNHQIT